MKVANDSAPSSIPVGRPYTGFDAYGDLTARLCANDPPTMCGCDEGAMARGRAAAEALVEAPAEALYYENQKCIIWH
jgi:hypothetical protein